MTLLPLAYLPNIEYISRIFHSESCIIEQQDNYDKQSYRNRCTILGANGSMSLTVPINKAKGQKVITKDITINYAEDWQHQHWRSIVSAYNNSPYFEFYMDELEPFFKSKDKFLVDFNIKMLEWCLDSVSITKDIALSESFENPGQANDYRFTIHPKYKGDKKLFASPKYIQVFSDKFDFTDNLSIIDLIFNEGPNAHSILHKSQNTNV